MRYAFLVAALTLLLLSACNQAAATSTPEAQTAAMPTSTSTETATPVETLRPTVAPVLTPTSAATPKAPAPLAPPGSTALLDALLAPEEDSV